ncbi:MULTISPECIES: hypothetical protein [unclassified Streptomyces]|uniref:hypothetical protein n=1 Tax=unclassified Streptomyces TaxID=2593676 RepID=UPI0023650730|nr:MULTISPECIES: hypothetical protein [unclassified Streptomyces]MDF3146450.1 hypothetical protein [Streptomyces sp. T21Q-yed]WDF40879.1 hypothetical protein PBV52_30930 [Streptomyces sp. T12]
MEQRIGSGSQPLEGAGFDPAFIPGLTSPVSAEPVDVKDEDVAEESASEKTGSEGTDSAKSGSAKSESEDSESEESDSGDTDLEAADEPEAEVEADDEADEAEEEAPVDGPVFEAADRRARIVADHKGVRLSLDDQECEFRWDEIGAIETEAPRFGKRFTVTVHTPDRRWYPIEIEAAARSRFKEWDEQLDAVLDAYFEEGDAEEEAAVEADAK